MNTEPYLVTATGKLFNPWVIDFPENDRPYVRNIIDQIKSGMYAHLFPVDGKDLVFLDIGANIGLVSIYASDVCKRIVAVEPAPNVFPVLQELTKGFPQIECLNLALAPVDGKHGFFVNDINFTASSTVNTYGANTTVQGVRLVNIIRACGLDRVDVCKVDAEGAEGESLSYWEIGEASNAIKTWFIETHNCPKTTWEHKLGTIVGNLARCGYTKMSIDGMAVTATRP